MIYLNQKDLEQLGVDWRECSSVIRDAVKAHHESNTVQPLKPYLRFNNFRNRIIAMPAFVGGKFDVAGIKWIASFPDNVKKNIPRASSIVILNHSNTGEIVSVINTSLLSVIRTVSVSALVLEYFLAARQLKNLTIGIIGWGPIGQYHFKMCQALYGDRISKVILHDLKYIDMPTITAAQKEKVVVARNWLEAYSQSDIVITCTTSKETYIDQQPKFGSLLLNVSLRDYKPAVFKYVKDSIIVDDWREVCREKTDIEVFHKEKGLQEDQTRSIDDIVIKNCLELYPTNVPIMFNPMGMAIFDIALAKYYLDKAKSNKIGLQLL